MILWLVAEIKRPDHAPQQADQPQRDERAAPGQPSHQCRYQRRRCGISQPRKSMREPLGKAPLVGGSPILHGARCCGEGCASPKPSATRAMNSVNRLVTKPVKMVAAAPIMPEH